MKRSFKTVAAIAAACALAVIAGQAFADSAEEVAAEEGDAALTRVTISVDSIKGQAGNKLIILAVPKDGGENGRLCVDITSDDFTLRPRRFTEPPRPWDPCGPRTPRAALADGTTYIRAMINVPGEREPLALLQQEVEIAGRTAIRLDGAELSAPDASEASEG